MCCWMLSVVFQLSFLLLPTFPGRMTVAAGSEYGKMLADNMMVNGNKTAALWNNPQRSNQWRRETLPECHHLPGQKHSEILN